MRASPSVSIVISTYNRVAQLAVCLKSLEFLRYPDVEVIVVNGPSSDGTARRLAACAERVVVLDCPEANLSMSRNIGLAQATGEIVCFLDDDAIPEPDWLEHLVAPFADPEIGGVGGVIRDHSGVRFQTRAVISDRLGRGRQVDSAEVARDLSGPGSDHFISLTGANSAVRRTAIDQIGGFDETFAYFLDETDMNLRLRDAGWRLELVEQAEIHHKYAESHLRTATNVPKRMLPIATSVGYFAARHGSACYGWDAVTDFLRDYEHAEIGYKVGNLRDGHISRRDFEILAQDIRRGLRDGVARAASEPGVRAFDRSQKAPRRRFAATTPPDERLRLCMLSQDEGAATPGGIGRWTQLAALGLARRGHEVTVVGRNRFPVHTVDFMPEGYWSHRLPDQLAAPFVETDALGLPGGSGGLAEHARRLRAEVERVTRRRRFSVISAPIWDVEGAAFLSEPPAARRAPVCVSLHTTMAMVLDHKPDWRTNPDYLENHVRRVINAERLALRRADLILANSRAIIADVQERYELELPPERLTLAPHGLDDIDPAMLARARARRAAADDSRAAPPVRLLFVGRLERRKGADALADVIAPLCAAIPGLRIDLVGQGVDGDIVQAVQRLQDEFPGRVQHQGFVEDARLVEFYAAADVFVAPSRYESFGLIFAEAMRAGLPCVGFRAGGVPEVVEHGVTGLLCEVDDRRGLLEALQTLCGDRALARTMGEAGRRRFETDFTVDVMAAHLESAYRRAVGAAEAAA